MGHARRDGRFVSSVKICQETVDLPIPRGPHSHRTGIWPSITGTLATGW
jgi:hypothetical protein